MPMPATVPLPMILQDKQSADIDTMTIKAVGSHVHIASRGLRCI